MNKELETEAVELGSVSTDTKGGAFTVLDLEGGKSIQAGLTDD